VVGGLSEAEHICWVPRVIRRWAQALLRTFAPNCARTAPAGLRIPVPEFEDMIVRRIAHPAYAGAIHVLPDPAVLRSETGEVLRCVAVCDRARFGAYMADMSSLLCSLRALSSDWRAVDARIDTCVEDLADKLHAVRRLNLIPPAVPFSPELQQAKEEEEARAEARGYVVAWKEGVDRHRAEVKLAVLEAMTDPRCAGRSRQVAAESLRHYNSLPLDPRAQKALVGEFVTGPEHPLAPTAFAHRCVWSQLSRASAVARLEGEEPGAFLVRLDDRPGKMGRVIVSLRLPDVGGVPKIGNYNIKLAEVGDGMVWKMNTSTGFEYGTSVLELLSRKEAFAKLIPDSYSPAARG
jgi:hypothetical protein